MLLQHYNNTSLLTCILRCKCRSERDTRKLETGLSHSLQISSSADRRCRTRWSARYQSPKRFLPQCNRGRTFSGENLPRWPAIWLSSVVTSCFSCVVYMPFLIISFPHCGELKKEAYIGCPSNQHKLLKMHHNSQCG